MTELVGREVSRGRRLEFAQDVLFAAGLAAIALALPTTRLFGDGPAAVQRTVEGQWVSAHLLLQPLSQLLTRVPGVGPEEAWYLLGALAWAASYPVLARLCSASGASRLTAVVASLLAVAAPLALLGGTLPGPSGPMLLGSAILFSSLARGAWAEKPRSALGAWTAVALLDPNLALFWPAALVQEWSAARAEGRSAGARVALAAGALAGFAVAWAFLLGSPSAAGLADRMVDGLRVLVGRWLGIGSVDAPHSLLWLAALAPGLGVGCVGMVELARRGPESRGVRPSLWLAAYIAVPLLARAFGGSPSLTTGAWVLVPAGALGLAQFLTRRDGNAQLPAILALCGAQMLLNVGFRRTLEVTDPNREWIRRATGILRPPPTARPKGTQPERLPPPSYLVVTKDQAHEYLLRHRFRVGTINLRAPVELGTTARPDWWLAARERVEQHARLGGRLAVDWKVAEPPSGTKSYPFPAELHELLLLAPVVHLDPWAENRETPEDLNQKVDLDEDKSRLPAALRKS